MQKKIALIFVTLSALFWGTNFNIGKTLIEQISPLTAAALRFSFASLLMMPFIVCFESRSNIMQAIKRNAWVYLFLGVIGVAGFNGLLFIGLKHTTAINGSLIMASNPLVTLLLSRIFLKNSMSITQGIGLLLSLLGVLTVITQGSLTVLLHLNIASGDWLIMGANLCWATYGVVGRRYLKDSKPLITTAATMFIGSMTLIIMARHDLNLSQSLHQTPFVYISLLYMTLFGTVLAYLFWNYGIAHLGAENTSVFFNLVPVVTVAISALLGQAITSVQLVGGLIVISGVLLSTQVISFNRLHQKLKLNFT